MKFKKEVVVKLRWSRIWIRTRYEGAQHVLRATDEKIEGQKRKGYKMEIMSLKKEY